ncbi:hypothetical protein ASPWEDRAFT_40416 [Aspergillus wentii DTO 134E9]|uniref:Auxiliary Activity family 9 catalytic domain-containing protein n=1 Tax=Aspergillus wentii DTO 134E9 TaxID=1073089 RepID=A0A1L9RK67_ASPWE|nr:uncharacterized protein ASPWEDRAFT_40416 [Aspergillus wentii DTO 134E9]KAI9923778.1 hypothetical protein MW887_008260 [Aspergillus wentii]OJJ35238.1 hypothetical protein ASPWEDRAFT_40416 [Aspergillus wentii DTO 134E9]
MSVSKIAGLLLSSAAMVAGHGYVSGAVVDGTYYGGYIVSSYAYSDSPPDTIGWSTKATDLGFVSPSEYSNSDIICHKDAQPGAISAEVTAGGDVELQWNTWPDSHHGPVITYLANCNGDCSSVDKTSLEFFKIDEKGLIDDSNVPGTWATDNLISNNNSWTVTIPSSIASGNYVLRHEIIALHSAGNQDGAQNYPQCMNLKVTGGGSDKPEGTLGTKLYKDTDAGILVNIYQSLDSYDIPGPALYTGSSSGSSASASSSATPAATASPTVSASPIKSSSVPHFSKPHTSSSVAPVVTSASVVTSAPVPTVTDVITATQTATQTSTEVDNVTVTAANPQKTQVATSSENSGSSSDSSSSSQSSGSQTSSAPAASSSAAIPSESNLTSYFDSLSAEQLLNLVRETLSWLVSDNKKHARDLSI